MTDSLDEGRAVTGATDRDAAVDEAELESFPCSDPESFWAGPDTDPQASEER
ncbi:MAG: hypothetical protein ACP5PB_04350 [Acidimicrobiales bacterium]